jgi:hypothetical protein
MKLFKVSFLFALLVAVTLPAVAQAQLQVNIPFIFTVAGKALPAGQYRVARVFEMNQTVWRVSNWRGVGAMILTNPVESVSRAHPPSMVFLAAGGTYSLVEFWPTAKSGRELLLKPKVKTTILAEGAKYVEIGAE